MASNKVQAGAVLSVIATADVKSGDLIMLGKIPGIALGDALTGESYSLDTEGVYEVPKTTSVVFAVGDAAFGKGDGGVNATNTNPLAGHVVEVAGNTVSVVKIKLQPGA